MRPETERAERRPRGPLGRLPPLARPQGQVGFHGGGLSQEPRVLRDLAIDASALRNGRPVVVTDPDTGETVPKTLEPSTRPRERARMKADRLLVEGFRGAGVLGLDEVTGQRPG